MIEVLCTVAGLLSGVAIVTSLFHHQADRARFQAQPKEDDSQAEADRVKEFAEQLQMISSKVAANMSAHSEKVESFSGSIDDVDGAPEELMSAISEILAANAEMQGQLADAQARIDEQSELIEEASTEARTDALTGLSNRRALDEYLSKCVRTLPEDRYAGLLLFDIDHFKSFNDTFGHTTGDAVLASFGRSLDKCKFDDCFVARYGGEEFAVVVSGNTPDRLAEIAAHMRKYVSEQVISYESQQLKVTASAGLCLLEEGDTTTSAYERADEGLYKSKENGRNRGYWLSDSGWLPFPDGQARPTETPVEPKAEPEPAAPTETAKVEEEVEETPEPSTRPPEEKEEIVDEAPPPAPSKEIEEEEEEEDDSTEILDLKSFLERLEPNLEQLRRAELPATALMAEAIGLEDGDEKEIEEAWEAVIDLAQQNIRGIDLVCQYRQNTLCIFMPGCSQDAAIDRAARIQASLFDALEEWSGRKPERLAISIATVGQNEGFAQFLDRLESALEEAQDATETQVVLHDGDICHFQEI